MHIEPFCMNFIFKIPFDLSKAQRFIMVAFDIPTRVGLGIEQLCCSDALFVRNIKNVYAW